MDLYCVKCGEPWDNDTFHEAAEEQETTYRDVMRRFQREGCAAIGWGSCDREAVAAMVATRDAGKVSRSDAAAMLYELLGDDTDGAAAMLEDMEYGGELG